MPMVLFSVQDFIPLVFLLKPVVGQPLLFSQEMVSREFISCPVLPVFQCPIRSKYFCPPNAKAELQLL